MKTTKQRIRKAHKRAAARARRNAYQAGFKDGVEQGRIDKSAFVRCPECGAVIEVPLMLVIEGDGNPDQGDGMHAQMDSTELWLHMHSHTGKISHDD